jgi:hypothetical protein
MMVQIAAERLQVAIVFDAVRRRHVLEKSAAAHAAPETNGGGNDVTGKTQPNSFGCKIVCAAQIGNLIGADAV